MVVTKDAGIAQTLPGAEAGPSDAGDAQILPALGDDDFVFAKATLDATPLVLPTAEDDLVLPDPEASSDLSDVLAAADLDLFLMPTGDHAHTEGLVGDLGHPTPHDPWGLA